MAGNKYLEEAAGLTQERRSSQTSAGAGDAGAIVALNALGQLDETMFGPGHEADVVVAPASENLAAGDFINYHLAGGVLKVRKADASAGESKMAEGFVETAVISPANASVFKDGRNDAVVGRTIGAKQFLSGTTPGLATEVAPTTAGHIVQRVGVATAATQVIVEFGDPILKAA